MKKYIFTLAVLLTIAVNLCYASGPMLDVPSTSFVPADQVFKVTAVKENASNLKLNFAIARNFYIYKQRLKINSMPDNALNLSHLSWPSTLTVPDINDPNKSDEVFTGSFHVDVPLNSSAAAQPFTLNVTIQGCDGKSICYPPQTYNFEFNQANKTKPTASSAVVESSLANIFMQFYHGEVTWQDLTHEFSLIQLIIIFFIAGIAIALTPCMYPLYPIALTMIMGNATPKRSNITFFSLNVYAGNCAYLCNNWGDCWYDRTITHNSDSNSAIYVY